MNEISNSELKSIKAGAIRWGIVGIVTGIIAFVVGVIDGLIKLK